MTDQTAADIVERLRRPTFADRVHTADINHDAATEIEALRALLADMPTVWEDPAGKGYLCQERPMTPAEARAEIEALRARETELRRKLDEVVRTERARCMNIVHNQYPIGAEAILLAIKDGGNHE